MEIKNNILTNLLPTDFTQAVKSSTNKLAQDLNCVRIGIVESFNAEDLTVIVKIASKKVLHYNKDGTQTVRDYAPICAKVCYCNPFETFPLKQGDEVVLLFNDRELETWFINGQANLQNHQRMHDLTDAIAIAGIRSLPNMIQILTDALHLFYGVSSLILKDEQIDINSTTVNINATNINLNGTLTINGGKYMEHQHTGNLGSPTSGVI